MNEIEIFCRLEADEMQPDMPEGVTVRCHKRLAMLSADIVSLPYLLIGWAGSIALSVIANAIYDSVKKRSKETPHHITINETKVRFERGKITEFIQTQITACNKKNREKNPPKK